MLEKIIDKIAEQQLLAKDKMLVSDIIDIYNHKYKDYDDYRKTKQDIVNEIQKREQMFNPKESYCLKLYVYPVIFDKEIFDYAYSLGETINV